MHHQEDIMRNDETEVVGKLQRQMRILQAYAVLSSLAFAVILLTAMKQPEKTAKFDEIQVGRINVVEPDGKLRLAIFNNAQSPDPVMGGKSLAPDRAGKRGAGLMFYNDNGDENGGLGYEGKEVDGKPEASAQLAFDQYHEDQVVALSYSQHGDRRTAGLQVWSRPTTALPDLLAKINAVKDMKDGPEKTAAMQKLQQVESTGEFGASRVFLGRGSKNEAVMTLADATGKPRIVMSVDANGAAKLDFLDANGKVTDSFPHSPAAAQNP
jgi:hypothetical protein